MAESEWTSGGDVVQMRFPDMTAYVKASEMRDKKFKNENARNVAANRYFKKMYDELATVRRDPKIVSHLDVKDQQKWVQLKPYLLSHGQRRVRCKSGFGCRPTKKVPGYGPRTIIDLLQKGFGPHRKNPAIGDEMLKRLKLLLRMSYVKDAYQKRVRMYWDLARYKLDDDKEWIHFNDEFGSMNEAQFREILFEMNPKMGRDYTDPTQEDADIFTNFENSEVDADDIPMEGPGRDETVDAETLPPVDDTDEEDEEDQDEENEEDQDEKDQDEEAEENVPEPLEYTSEGEVKEGTKPQVLRRDGVIVTRSPTQEEIDMTEGMKGVGMVGKLFKDGKFVNEMGKRLRLKEDPDYVHFRGKWVLSPVNYPKNNPEHAPWNFLDKELRGEHQSVKLNEMSQEERVKFRTALDEDFPDGIHVSRWQDAVAILKGKGYAAEDLRLYTPWGGVLTAGDTDLDVEVRGDGDDLTLVEMKKAARETKEKKKREAYGKKHEESRSVTNALTMLFAGDGF